LHRRTGNFNLKIEIKAALSFLQNVHWSSWKVGIP